MNTTRLALAPVALAMAAALSPVAFAADDPFFKDRQGRLSDALNRLALAAESGGKLSAQLRSQARGDSEVTVAIELAEGASLRDITRVVEAAGGRIEAAAPGLVSARLAVGRLRQVAADRSVERVRLPYRPTTDEVVGEGVASIKADSYVMRTGSAGAGVKVALLDSGWAGLTRAIGTELPADTVVRPILANNLGVYSTDPHGTACAEIVHDVAPAAQLVLDAYVNEVEWAQRTYELAKEGVRVMSSSFGWSNIYPPDGNSYFAQHVNLLESLGVLYVTSAGNSADRYYQGVWRDEDNDHLMEFAPGVEMLPIGVSRDGSYLILRWDDPSLGSTHDYDVLIVTEDFRDDPRPTPDNPAVVAFSAERQNMARPVEAAEIPGNGKTRVLYAVVVHDTTTPLLPSQRFYLWNHGTVLAPYANSIGTIGIPADARGALAVGAVRHDSGEVEVFSSRGPTADGRTKPDLVAPDGVTSVAYGNQRFFGTSAAAPHVAGAAALLLARNPALTTAQLRQELLRATTSGGAAANNDVGYGTLDLARVP